MKRNLFMEERRKKITEKSVKIKSKALQAVEMGKEK